MVDTEVRSNADASIGYGMRITVTSLHPSLSLMHSTQ